jgi:hypothetical protein
MEPDLNTLAGHVRSTALNPLARLQTAAEIAVRLASTGDSLVSLFVDECRDSGYGWADLAPYLSGSRRSPSNARAERAAEPRVSDREQSHAVRQHAGKYRPLWEWLTRQPNGEIKMTFAAIESVLDFPLPRSSRDHLPHWYGYKGSAVARAIIDAGWRAHNVDLKAETVTLTRSRELIAS